MNATESSHQFRLNTYNIHKGIGGVDRRYDLQRTVDVIAHYEPDIVFLQEVDDDVPRSNRDRQVDVLAKALGFDYSAYQRNVNVKDGHYGNAILSRFPLEEPYDLDLTVSIKKSRRAQIAVTQIPTGNATRSLILCNTHLGLAGLERSIQIKRILAFKKFVESNPETPVIVGGDFNDVWSEHGRKLMFPLGFQCAVCKAKTFPAALPIRSLDAVYFRGELELQNSFAGRIPLARRASDHLPIITDFVVSDKRESNSDD